MRARLGQQLISQIEFLALGQLGELCREFGRHARSLPITGPVSSGEKPAGATLIESGSATPAPRL